MLHKSMTNVWTSRTVPLQAKGHVKGYHTTITMAMLKMTIMIMEICIEIMLRSITIDSHMRLALASRKVEGMCSQIILLENTTVTIQLPPPIQDQNLAEGVVILVAQTTITLLKYIEMSTSL